MHLELDELEDDYGLFDEPVSDNRSTHLLFSKMKMPCLLNRLVITHFSVAIFHYIRIR